MKFSVYVNAWLVDKLDSLAVNTNLKRNSLVRLLLASILKEEAMQDSGIRALVRSLCLHLQPEANKIRTRTLRGGGTCLGRVYSPSERTRFRTSR